MMTDKLRACPECDSTDVYQRRSNEYQERATDKHAFRCQHCCARFDTPEYRHRRADASPPKHSLAARLLAADPDEVSR